jgi:hypothetical protein
MKTNMRHKAVARDRLLKAAVVRVIIEALVAANEVPAHAHYREEMPESTPSMASATVG